MAKALILWEVKQEHKAKLYECLILTFNINNNISLIFLCTYLRLKITAMGGITTIPMYTWSCVIQWKDLDLKVVFVT